MKEKQFLEEQKKILDEDKFILAKRHVKSGNLPISIEDRQTILKQREICWEKFKQKEMLVDKDGLMRREISFVTKRILVDRKAKPTTYKFSFKMSNEWPSRIIMLKRFIDAVNKIITRNRANKRLAILRKMVKEDRGSRITPSESIESEKKFSMCSDNIKPPNISRLFWCPPVNFNLLWPGLKPGASEPLNFGNLYIPKPTPEIKPLLHEILGYKRQDVYQAGASYTPMAPKPPPDPDCAMMRVISFVEARNRFSQQPKGCKHVFEPLTMDPRKYFNPYPEIPEIIPLPVTCESHQEDDYYALYPLNTWQRKKTPKSELTIEEMKENILKCQAISIQVQSTDDSTDTKMQFPPHARFKLELPNVKTDKNEESKKLPDKPHDNNEPNAYLQAQTIADATTVEEMLTCDNHSHTSSSNPRN